ncbi:MAG: hypothetical protein ACRDYZ_10455, partial [Acidimicrobiales bacterium]
VVANPAAAPGAPAATTPTTPAPTSTPAPVLAAPATLTLVPAPATGERPAAAGEATTAPPPPVLDGALLEVLRAAGAPESLLGRVQGTDRGRPTLEGALAVMTEAPPLPGVAGALVAVVGDARLARSVTRAVASAVGCPADQVAVAARSAGARNHAPGLRVTTSEQAAALAPGWRRGKVAVVTVHAPPVGADQQWTRDVLAALQPSCVWALASATTKPDDVRRFTEDIGGADALALTDVALTGTPAAVLSAGVPVARLDEEPATPARWAAVVADLVARR